MSSRHDSKNKTHQYETVDQEQLQVEKLAERTVLVGCILPDSKHDETDPLRELQALAETAGAEVVGHLTQNRRNPDFTTYIGKGKLTELQAMMDELDASLVVFDNDLSPSQIRNIEKILKCKVLDRSELILDIFAGRASTSAARLQVEMAPLEYTYPRLRAMWTHFGQIAGGAPVGIGTRGPGETQIEIDRRLVNRRKSVLKRRIAEIHHRQQREGKKRRDEHLIVSLIGYTNAGKSTLFNSLTGPSGGGGAFADDRLFATLTSRTRRWPLGQGEDVMLSDTVGFVRDLPHHLIASFRATLEEAIHADVLLIVLDVSDPQAPQHLEVVRETLNALDQHEDATSSGDGAQENNEQTGIIGTGSQHPTNQILLLNKVDRLKDESELALWHRLDPNAIPISAVTGKGLDQLQTIMQKIRLGRLCELNIAVPLSNGKALSVIEHRAEVLDRQYEADRVVLRVRVGSNDLPMIKAVGGNVLPD